MFLSPKIIFFTMMTTVFFSCSHQAKKTESNIAPQVSLEKTSEKLKKIVEDAKKAGPEKIQYVATDLFLKGNASLMENDFEVSALIFEALTQLVNDENVIKKYAVSLIRIGNLGKAQEVLEKMVKEQKYSDDKSAMLLAGVYSAEDKIVEAKNVYAEILKKHSWHEDACLYLGKTQAIEKKFKVAEKTLMDCDKHHKENGIFQYYIGKMYVDQGELKRAQTHFKNAYAKNPQMTQAVQAIGVILEEQEKWDEAIKVYQKFLNENPNDEVVLNRIVQTLFIRERYSEVIPYAEKLTDLEPENLNLKVKLGVLYTDTKQYDKAISAFKDLLAHAPESDRILYYLGAIYQEINKYENAIEFFSQIPVNSGLYSDSSIQVAQMLSVMAQNHYFESPNTQNKWEETFKSYVAQKMTTLKELKVELMTIQSGYYEAINQYNLAIEALETVRENEHFNLQHQYFYANLLEKVQRHKDSAAIMMEIIGKDPKNAHAWNFLGYSLIEREENFPLALEYIQKALSISPEDGYIRDSLGWYFFKQGRMDQALKEITQAFKQVPDDVVIIKHLAQIHKVMKNYSKARSLYELALKLAKLESEKQELNSHIQKLESEQRLPASELVKEN